MSREPIVWIEAIKAIVVGVLPVLAIFGVLDWSIEQFGAVEAFVIILTAVLGSLFQRSKVTPV